MHPSRQFATTAALLILLIPAAAARPSTALHEPLSPRFSPPARDNVSIVRAHLDSVVSELKSHDVGTLTETQRARRAQLIVNLQDYRDRGVFPHNYDFPSQSIPYFVDRKTGALCAVAHLLASTGRSDIVRRVAAANNNVYVAELAGDTAVSRWLEANGLTLGDAERIQYPYMYDFNAVKSATAPVNMAAPIAIAAGSLITSVWNGTANRDGRQPVGNVLGLASGILSAGAGTALMMRNPDFPATGFAFATVGGLGIALATRAITHHAGVVTAEREATARRHAVLQASMAPYIAAGGGAGLGMTISF
jgi:hypothetical protein